MSLDLNDLLKDWPHEPGQIKVRKILGADGKEKLQLRIDLGLIQMEVSGRPDGHEPHDCESLLEYHQQRAERASTNQVNIGARNRIREPAATPKRPSGPR